ncbi:uncharacterized protein LOC124593822 [Schistocerca americana]|uniref:uncharacterized protein LOC124593822 n=1 Tax=Schistocerca americana TaxID=7009 RepID=UPI001F4F5DE6|nr:uncharacterized protein LOC124593822 [Schistocerca americana]
MPVIRGAQRPAAARPPPTTSAALCGGGRGWRGEGGGCWPWRYCGAMRGTPAPSQLLRTGDPSTLEGQRRPLALLNAAHLLVGNPRSGAASWQRATPGDGDGDGDGSASAHAARKTNCRAGAAAAADAATAAVAPAHSVRRLISKPHHSQSAEKYGRRLRLEWTISSGDPALGRLPFAACRALAEARGGGGVGGGVARWSIGGKEVCVKAPGR